MSIQYIVIAFDIITTFFDYWLINFIGSILFERKTHRVQSFISLLSFTVINILFASIINDIFLISIMNLLFGYFIIKTNYNGKNVHKFIFSVLYYLSIGFYTFLTTFIAQSIFGVEDTNLYSITIERINFTLVNKVLLFCIILICKDKIKKKHTSELILNRNSSILIKIVYTILTIIMILLFILKKKVSTDEQHFYILLISFFIIISSIIVYFSIRQYGKIFIENERFKAIEKINIIVQDNYNNMIKSNDKLRSIKHDMNNMLITLRHFINEGEYNKSLSVISNQLESINEKTFYKVSNDILQAFLNHYANDTEIKFDLNLNIQEEILIDDTDFISLLGNLFKNSVEAVNNLNNDDKVISIILKIRNDQIFIQFENIYDDIILIDGKIHTTKINNKQHGIGLLNVKNIVNKNNGFLEIKTENNIFTIQIMLDNEKRKYNVE